tara:strand:- start:2539 stop:2814 length:276 start_codon:yes stop_codon:yes gene_type:complete
MEVTIVVLCIVMAFIIYRLRVVTNMALNFEKDLEMSRSLNVNLKRNVNRLEHNQREGIKAYQQLKDSIKNTPAKETEAKPKKKRVYKKNKK